MRSIFLFLTLLMTGCTQSEVLFPDTTTNPMCVQDKNITVIRVMKNYVLGWIDNINDPVVMNAQRKYQVTDPHFVFVPRHPDGVYIPNQTITLNEESCLIYRGAYQYQFNENQKAIFLLGHIIPSQTEIVD